MPELPGDIIADSGISILLELWTDFIIVMETPLTLWGFTFTWLDVFWFTFACAVAGDIIWVAINHED